MIKIGYEPFLKCSSKGDKRFSALFAKVKKFNNRTIEELYQASKKFDNENSLDWKKNKGRKATNMDECARIYTRLWQIYLDENPDLIKILLKYNGYSDIFGRPGCQCQAIEIYNYINKIKNNK